MDPSTLADGARINHPDFGDGTVTNAGLSTVDIEWDKQGKDCWSIDDGRWEQVEETY